MQLELPDSIESAVNQVASEQGRSAAEVVQDAIRIYIDYLSITDVTPADVAATQERLLPELEFDGRTEAWNEQDNDAPR